MGLFIDNPIASVQLQLRGGWRNVLVVSGSYAGIIAAAMTIWAIADPNHIRGAAEAWTIAIMVLQSILVVLFSIGRVSGAVRQDLTSGIIESHRLMPISGYTAAVGYIIGSTGVLAAMGLVNILAGCVSMVIAGRDPVRYLDANAILMAFCGFGCICSVALGFYSRATFSLIAILFVAGFMSGGMLIYALPGLLLLVTPAARSTVFVQSNAAMPFGSEQILGFAAQFIIGSIVLVAAARKFRRPDQPALPLRLGIALLACWVAINLIATLDWDGFQPIMFRSSGIDHDHVQVQFTASMLTTILLSLLPIGTAVGERRMNGDSRRPRPSIVALACIALTVALLLIPLNDRHGDRGLLGGVVLSTACTLIGLTSVLIVCRGRARAMVSMVVLYLSISWVAPLFADVVYHAMLNFSDAERMPWMMTAFGPIGVIIAPWSENPQIWPGIAAQVILAGLMAAMAFRVERNTRRVAVAVAGIA